MSDLLFSRTISIVEAMTPLTPHHSKSFLFGRFVAPVCAFGVLFVPKVSIRCPSSSWNAATSSKDNSKFHVVDYIINVLSLRMLLHFNIRTRNGFVLRILALIACLNPLTSVRKFRNAIFWDLCQRRSTCSYSKNQPNHNGPVRLQISSYISVSVKTWFIST